MNNRKRMMLKSVEAFYGFGKLNKCSRRMWLMYSAKRMAELLRQVRSGFREQSKQNDNQGIGSQQEI